MKNILVVDDEAMLREVYTMALEAHGYSVRTAADGLLAEIELKANPPDLILLDIMMPNADGIEFLSNADLINRHPDVKVILFSNLSSGPKIKAGLKLGATKHIAKSTMTPNDLVDEVKSLLD